MVKSFRFLLQFAWVNLGAGFVFAAVVIAGCYATGVADGARRDSLFWGYYTMFPLMILLMLFFYAFALCTNNLNLGLSMGARRRDFFWALQGMMVFSSAVCWGLQLFMSAFPGLAGWAVRESWILLVLFGGRAWLFPLLCLALMVLGCLSGIVMATHKGLGVILVILSVFVMFGVTVLMFIYADGELMGYLLETRWAWLWTGLPRWTAALLLAAAAGGEVVIWRFIRRYAVR